MCRFLTYGFVALWMGLALGAVPAIGEEADGKVVGLVRVGVLDEQLVTRIRDFVQGDARLPVRVMPARDPVGGTLNDEGEAVADLVDDSVLCLVALVVSPEDIPLHGVLLEKRKVAVVNAKALRPAGPSSTSAMRSDLDDAERYARRLEKQVMRSLGLLLGLDTCPNPHCALRQYRTDAHLDAIGRSFCPPCMGKCRDAAVKQGVALLDMRSPAGAQTDAGMNQ